MYSNKKNLTAPREKEVIEVTYMYMYSGRIRLSIWHMIRQLITAWQLCAIWDDVM